MRNFGKAFGFWVIFIICGCTTCFGQAGAMETNYKRLDVFDFTYWIAYSEEDYYIMDYDNMCIGSGEGDFIKQVFESRDKLYIINVVQDGDIESWQLISINLGYNGIDLEKNAFEIEIDRAYCIFNTFSNGVVEVDKLSSDDFKLKYKDKSSKVYEVDLNMNGFEDYGDFRNVKEMDIREDKIYFLTYAGEIVELDVESNEFKKISRKFEINLIRALEKR